MTLAKYNINVNTIAPDVINIPIWKKLMLFLRNMNIDHPEKKSGWSGCPHGTNGITRRFYGSSRISGIL